MAQLPAPYYYGNDRYVRMYNDLLKKNFYWPWPKSSLTGNYVTLDLANYLFDQVDGTENELITVEQLPAGVSDTGGSYSDDLQTMFDQGNHVTQSVVTGGGYTMSRFARSPKGRRKGVAIIEDKEFTDYKVTETREVVSVLEAFDLDQQIHSTKALSAEQFIAIASVQGVLVPFLSTFEGRTVQQIAQVSLQTLIAAMMPAILAQLPKPTNPTNPTDPAVTLSSLSIEGPDSIIEGVMDTQYRAGVIYSNNISDTVTTQGKSIDGFEWTIIGQGEQIGVTGVLPIYANEVPNDSRTFILELRHSSLPSNLAARKTVTIVDGTVVPPPPPTTDPFINLYIDVDTKTIRVRARLGNNAAKAALVVYRDGVSIYSTDNLSTHFDTSLSQAVLPGTYYALVFEPNRDSNRIPSDPQTIKGTAPGASLVTAIDYAHLAKGADGYPQLNLWFKTSVAEPVFYTFTTEDLPESGRLNTTALANDPAGYSRSTFISNVRGNYLVTVKAWTESNPGGAVSKQFRINAGSSRTTIYGAGATNPPVDTATIIQALDTEWAANGELTVYGKTSRADGLQFAVANDAGQYSGWFGAAGLNGDGAGYQYKGVFSASPVGAQARIRYRPTTNSAESAIAYLTLKTPNGAQTRKTEWANGTQIQPVSGDFSVEYGDSNLGGGPRAQFRILLVWNDAGTECRIQRIFTGQRSGGYNEYWLVDKKGRSASADKVIDPYVSLDEIGPFPPNYNFMLECYWSKGPEVNRGYSYGYSEAIGTAIVFTGTKPTQTT